MKPSVALRTHRDEVRRIVEANHATNARIFGSVVVGEDTHHSDLDIIVDPLPETTLFDIGAIRSELGSLLGVPVDVLTPNALPDRIRGAVLASAVPV
jgi:predicted nucleotidyltransferase